ncbi:MAG: type VI secretion system-associated FHA domain protein TagH [Burkholderiales bacterium]|nr:MAG: type VI secretion system-associated FHA domain protein TagH [Burkholderiales bacterium]
MRPAESAPGESLDQLFGLGGDAKTDALDKLGGTLDGPLSQPNTADSQDPLAALGRAAGRPAPPPPLPDTTPELRGSFRVPQPRRPPSPPPAASGAARAAGGPPAAGGGGGAFRSWESREGLSPTQSLRRESAGQPAGRSNQVAPPPAGAAPAPSQAPAPAPSQPPAPAPQRFLEPDEVRELVGGVIESHQDRFTPPPPAQTTMMLNALNRETAQAAGRASQERVATGGGDAAPELLRQFLLGSGLPELSKGLDAGAGAVSTLSPETMRRIGELLRAAVDGTLELLAARAALKREMKTDVTVIAANDNNPLKFSPNAVAALAHLLAPKTLRGFMEPTAAMRDAYQDLLAHQVGFVAGMRAAMQGLIARFDPQALESRLTRKSVIDAVVPLHRQARLWELFNERFDEISREAEDDFEALFWREFTRAYEEQIERLEDRGRK